MIIVDAALRQRADAGNPVRVGLIGAGFMGRGLAIQMLNALPGMELVAIYNRTLETAKLAYTQAGAETVKQVSTVDELESAIDRKTYAITDDPALICEAGNIDAIIEATGEVEFGAHVVLRAIDNGKHVVLMNAELDAVVGPLLKVKADNAEVIITNVDGDQPGVIMNLYRWVDMIGYNPILAGNIKGLQDHYRTPETQKGFAEKHHQKPKMVTSFADGTKISMEMAVVANATGFRVGKRGMYGPECRHVTEAVNLFPLEDMLNGGLVDYILGAEPGPGVFVLGYNEHPIQKQYMQYLKMGDGPLYVFYVPYHFPHLETSITVARAVLFNDAATKPLGGPVVDVLTMAKRDLKAGDIMDGIGGFDCYGETDNYNVSKENNYLPMSFAEGCKLKRDIQKDEVIAYADVEIPADRLCDKLRAEQTEYFQ
jgi:predicted homoserine dehydrogenase-like protein